MGTALNILESERIISVLEETTETLKSLDLLKTDIFQYRFDAAETFGGDLVRLVDMYINQQTIYHGLVTEKEFSKTKSNSRRFKEVQNEIGEINRSIHDTERGIQKSLKSNEIIKSNLSKLKSDRDQVADLLLRCTQELRDSRTFDTIAAKVKEEIKREAKLHEIQDKERDLKSEIQILSSHLNQIDSDISHTSSERLKDASALKDSIEFIRTDIDTNAAFKRLECHSHVAAKWRECKLLEQEIELQIKLLQEKLHTEAVTSAEADDFLRNKSQRLAADIKSMDLTHALQRDCLLTQSNKLKEEYASLSHKLQALRLRQEDETHRLEEAEERRTRDAAADFQRECEKLRQHTAAKHLQRAMKLYMNHLKAKQSVKPKSSVAKKGVKKLK